MSDQFVGQLLLVPYTFAPQGWAFCNGQLLPISQNTALFSLLGTYYGGNGTSTFGLPNLQGAVPVGYGNGSNGSYSLGQTGGEAAVTLITSQLPVHTHAQQGTGATGNSGSPSGQAFGQSGGRGHAVNYYASPPTGGTQAVMASTALAPTGGGQPHSNMMPFLTLYYIIALQGIYPPRS